MGSSGAATTGSEGGLSTGAFGPFCFKMPADSGVLVLARLQIPLNPPFPKGEVAVFRLRAIRKGEVAGSWRRGDDGCKFPSAPPLASSGQALFQRGSGCFFRLRDDDGGKSPSIPLFQKGEVVRDRFSQI